MPRNGLNESTSLRMPTVNVPAPPSPPRRSPRHGSRRVAGAERERRSGRRRSPARRRPAREYVSAHDYAGPSGPPVAPQEPFEHTEHGVVRPDPYAGCARLDEPVLAHFAAEREWYDVATGHLGPLVQELRAEMADRVPATDSSVSWPQHGYSYYTVLPAGREYVQLLRRRHGPTTRRRRGAAPRRQRDGRGHATTSTSDSGRSRRTPRWSPTASTTTGTRSTSCASVTWRPGADLRRRRPRAAPRGAWSADSSTTSTWCTTTCGASTRSGGTGSARRRPTDVLVLEDPDEQFEIDVHDQPHRRPRRDLVREPRHQRGLGPRRARPDVGAAVRRRSPARDRVPRRAREACRRRGRAAGRDQRRGDRVPARAVPGATRRRPGRVGLGGRCAPRTPPSGSSAPTRTPATWC